MNNTKFSKITNFKLFGLLPIWTKEEAAHEKNYDSTEINVIALSEEYFKREFKTK